MKILLLQAYLGRKEQFGSIFPLGLCYVATALKDHDVRVMDMNMLDNPYAEVEAEIKSFRPAVVGISLRNIDSVLKYDVFYYFRTIAPTVSLIKSVDPRIKVMIGGAGFSMFAERIMMKTPDIDFGVFLEGEDSAPELMKNLDTPHKVLSIFIREGDKVTFTGPRPLPDFAKLPIPRRDFLDVKAYRDFPFRAIGIQTKRGCPYKCSYCSYPFLNGPKIRMRSPESVVAEMEYLISEFGVREFTLTDSVFNVPKGHAEGICREIIRKGVKARWGAWFEINNFSEELMLLAKDAGCEDAGFSPDAASNPSLAAMGKSITEDDIWRAIKIARKVRGVVYSFSFFCTPPKQDFIGFLKTLKLYFFGSILLLGRGGVRLCWVRVEPDSRMHAIAIEDGVLTADDDLLPDDEKGIDKLFYSCPATRFYADPIFTFLERGKEFAKYYVKRLLRINKKKEADKLETQV
jgi:radical SAM superfamily enzyme YgiQ (UPF0313 family)